MTSARTFGVEKGDTLIALDPTRRKPETDLGNSLQVFWEVRAVNLARDEIVVHSENLKGTTETIEVPIDENIWGAAIFGTKLSQALKTLRYPTPEEYREELRTGIGAGPKNLVGGLR